MKCPRCKKHQVRVVDTRQKGDTIQRRRKCLDCGYRFNATERVESTEETLRANGLNPDHRRAFLILHLNWREGYEENKPKEQP